MEKTENKSIMVWQLYIWLFLSRVIILFTVNAQTLGGENLLVLAVSSGISMVVTFLLSLPAMYLHAHWPEKNICDVGETAFGTIGAKAVGLFYMAFFLIADGYYLGDLGLFLTKETEYGAAAWFIMALIAGAAFYCLRRGLQAMARTATLLAVLIVVSFVFMIPIWIPLADPSRSLPVFYEGTQPLWLGTAALTARSTRFVVLLFLLPDTKGRAWRGFIWWNIGVTATFVVYLLLLAFCLGEYGAAMTYPVYTLLQLFSYGPFARLDAVFTGGWVMVMILKIGLDQLIFFRCMRVCFPHIRQGWSFLGVMLVYGVAWLLYQNAAWHDQLGSSSFFLPLTIIALAEIPLTTLAVARWKERRHAHEG